MRLLDHPNIEPSLERRLEGVNIEALVAIGPVEAIQRRDG